MEKPEYRLYVILLSPERPFDKQVIERHVEHVRQLDREERLVLCGPFLDWEGGMLVIRASSIDKAREIAHSDPFVAEGFETAEVRTLHHACRENNFLVDN